MFYTSGSGYDRTQNHFTILVVLRLAHKIRHRVQGQLQTTHTYTKL